MSGAVRRAGCATQRRSRPRRRGQEPRGGRVPEQLRSATFADNLKLLALWGAQTTLFPTKKVNSLTLPKKIPPLNPPHRPNISDCALISTSTLFAQPPLASTSPAHCPKQQQ